MVFLYIVLALLMLNFLIFVHELGHFLAAKKSKIKVNEFAIGMGPKIFSKTVNETKYSLRWILIGGYVAFDDESYKDAHFLKQAFVIVNGVVFNFLTALIFSWVYLICSTDLNLNAWQIFISGFLVVIQMSQAIFNALVGLVVHVDTSAFSGPAGIVDTISTYIKVGYLQAIELIVVLNVNLGIFNSLPIPALDGGQLVYTLFKGITKKREYPKLETALAVIGYTFIGGITLVALFNDFHRFFIK